MAEPEHPSASPRPRLRRWVLRLAIAYPIALLLVLAALRGIGERWSVTTLALYLPRVGFALPLPFLTLALLFVRPRAWLLTQLVAALVVLFPLMGLELRAPSAPRGGGRRLRVMSYNVDLAPEDAEGLTRTFREADADIVCLQETRGDEVTALARALPQHVVRRDTQFIIASRYPIVDVFLEARFAPSGKRLGASFARYRVRTPDGLVDVYDIHPISPHAPFDRLRGKGLLGELVSGRLFRNGAAFRALQENARQREAEVTAVAAHAARSPYPVIIAGDTNLPSGSPVLRRAFGAYQDGFVEAGRGFGYTYPAFGTPAWLRLDRVLADRHFRFVSFVRRNVLVSTHHPVIAELERAPPNDDAGDRR